MNNLVIGDWLPEQLATIRNLTLVVDVLINVGKTDLLPTVLELLYIEVQEVVDENCIKGE